MSENSLDHDTRTRLLLAAAVTQLLTEQAGGVDADDPSGSAWVRTGHQGLAGRWSWNPRSPSSWRLVGRLDHHRGR